MFPVRLAYDIMIDQSGEAINVIRRDVTVDDEGRGTYTDGRTIPMTAWLRDVGGYVEEWEGPGYHEDVDLAGIFHWDADVEKGDIVVKLEEDLDRYEVSEIVKRRTGKDVDFKEVLMRRVM